MKLKTLLAAWLLIWAVLMLTACENRAHAHGFSMEDICRQV